MWQIIVSVALAVGIGLIGMFWSLADPRSDIKDIKNNYVTLREHNDLVTRMTDGFRRLEAESVEQRKELATKVETESHAHTDDATRAALVGRLDAMQRQIDLLISRSLIQPPPNASVPPR